MQTMIRKIAVICIGLVLFIVASIFLIIIFILGHFISHEKIEHKYGFIDKTGKLIVTPKFDYLTDYNGTKRAVGYSVDSKSNDDYNVFVYSIDTNGRVFSSEKIYKDILNIDDPGIRKYGSYFITEYENTNKTYLPRRRDEKYGYQNKSGKWIIEPKWDYVTAFDQDVAFVLTENNNEKKWGLINTKGEYLLKPTCENIWPFVQGRARCKVRLVNGKY